MLLYKDPTLAEKTLGQLFKRSLAVFNKIAFQAISLPKAFI